MDEQALKAYEVNRIIGRAMDLKRCVEKSRKAVIRHGDALVSVTGSDRDSRIIPDIEAMHLKLYTSPACHSRQHTC